jgi:hypothetical protein
MEKAATESLDILQLLGGGGGCGGCWVCGCRSDPWVPCNGGCLLRGNIYHLEEIVGELWDVLFSLKNDLEDDEKFSHSLQFRGKETYMQNYGRMVAIYKQICCALVRFDLYEDLLRRMEKEFGKESAGQE